MADVTPTMPKPHAKIGKHASTNPTSITVAQVIGPVCLPFTKIARCTDNSMVNPGTGIRMIIGKIAI